MFEIALPLMSEAARHWTWLILLLLVGNIIFVGLVTIAQKQLDLTLGYSSVMHMGYIFLGVVSANLIGVDGAALLMLAHGLSIPALFAIPRHLRKQTPTLDYPNPPPTAKNPPID